MPAVQRSLPGVHGQREAGIYRPTFRPEVMRRIIKQIHQKEGKFWSKFSGGEIDLNWKTLARLIELAYRCTLCRRCAQVCSWASTTPWSAARSGRSSARNWHRGRWRSTRRGPCSSCGSGRARHNPAALADLLSFMKRRWRKDREEVKIPVDKRERRFSFFTTPVNFWLGRRIWKPSRFSRCCRN